MPTICKDCKHCDLAATDTHRDSCCNRAGMSTSHVTGNPFRPLCRDINFGDCKQFQPQGPFHVYRDHLGRPFDVLDSLLLLAPVAEGGNGTIVALKEMLYDPKTGNFELIAQTLFTGETVRLRGKANKPTRHVYRLGTADEVRELML